MRVLYLHQHFSTKDGSSGTRSYEFARALIERGHSVTMVCGSLTTSGLNTSALMKTQDALFRREVIDGIDVIQCNIRYANHLGFASRVWAFIGFALLACYLCLRERYDLLFATSTPLTIAIPALLSLPFKRKPFVFEVRDLWPEIPEQMGIIKNRFVLRVLYLLEGLAYRAASCVIALSPGMADGVRTNRWTRCPVVMIPNGCDLELFMPSSRTPDSVPNTVSLPGLAAGDRAVVFAGAHGKANGLDAVIDAAQRIRPDERLKIVLIGDGKEKAALKARARDLPQVLFFDPMPKRILAKLLPQFHGALQVLADVPAFHYGTSPNKFFDYLSSGLPIVTNYPGWVADLITENRCGVAVPPNDPAAFADAIRAVTEPSKMGENARALAEKAFNRADLAKTFCETLERCANRSDREPDARRYDPIAV